ncbi:hypothetical protein [Lacinutrix cladophorae]
MKKLLFLFLIITIISCVTIPPEITKSHSKELEIIEALKVSHLAMVDSYVEQKILAFENFFFNEYGPVFRSNWIDSFKEINGRDYQQENDFPKLYNDLVAVYQEQILPIENIRFQLKTSIITEYSNVKELHKTTGNWINNLEDLNDSQRKTIDSLLDNIKPGFSINSIDKAIVGAIDKVKDKIQIGN